MRWIKFTFVLAVAATIAADGFAQRPGGARQPGRQPGRGFGGRGGSILSMEAVQKELKLSKEQIEKITAVSEKLSAETRKALAGLSREDLRGEKGRKIIAESGDKTEKATAEVLNAGQQKRLGQLQLQRDGFRALTRANVVKELSLSKEQVESLTKLNNDYSQQSRPLFRDPDRTTKLAALRTEVQKKVDGVLSDDQKSKYKTMLGKEFKFPERRRGTPRPGGGRPQLNIDNLVKELDKNTNGEITKEEAGERWRFLSRADENKDDKLDKKELAALKARFNRSRQID